MQRPQYQPIFYQGDTLLFTPADQSLRIYERAHLERAGETLFADSVIYTSDTRYITAYGQSTLINADGDEITSEKGPFFYNTDRKLGTVIDGHTEWEIWQVAGDFILEGSDTLWVKNGIFTSCDLPEPHYYFAADKIKLIFNSVVVAWPVRLYFGDVPVFWFPFFAQDVRQGRHSGILTPRFGINDIVRQDRSYNRHISNVGYYWAISDYTDAQLSIDWWSDTWFRVDSFFRYRWRRKFLTGRFGYSQFFLPDGGRETSLVWNHNQQFGERADLRASVQFLSSVQFERENEFNPDRLTQQIRSNVGFSRRFDWGTLDLSGQRIQALTEGEQTVLDLPQLSVTLSPIQLFSPRSPLEARWYNDLSLNGSGSFNLRKLDDPDSPDLTSLTGSASTGFTLGSLRLSGSGSYREDVEDKPDTLITQIDTMFVNGDTITADTMVLAPEIREGTLTWQSSFGYQLRLIGSTALTPSLALSGSLFRSNETGLSFVSAPTRISANATLSTDLYGFFPGFGSVRRIRHKISPGLRWTYSPAVMASEELSSLRGFNISEVNERHQLSVSLNQTFEAKVRSKRQEPEGEEGEDAEEDGGRETEVQPQERKMTILALRTSAVAYDFVEGEVITDRLTNNATSDLLRGLTLRLEHDLFEDLEDGGRRFAPFLTSLNIGFSLGDRTVTSLFGGTSSGLAEDRGIRPRAREFEDLDELDPAFADEEEPVPEEREERRSRPWNVSLDYSLIRTRPSLDGSVSTPDRQSIRARLGFSPTENWTLTWRTQFDIEEKEFVDQILSLRRDLHRWSATFDFLRASNRNFTFEFRVSLNDLPDLKFDYRQETRR